MEQLNAKLYDKYTALKKRKLLDEDLERKRDADIKELFQAMKDWASEVQSENEQLVAKLAQKEQQLAEVRTLLLDETQKTKELDSEILRLQCRLAEKNDANQPTATESPIDTTPETIIENQTLVSHAKKISVSNKKKKNICSTEKDIDPHSSFRDEDRELDCCGRHLGMPGSGTEESCSTCVFRMLVESLVDMKFSMKNEIEGISLSVSHEASGYSFTLTWIDQPDGGEWSYHFSSLGTLERVAVGWMKQDIKFSMTMCPVFFQRVSRIIRQG
ncbi:hypothetical protein GUJ93_ZPchr0008g11402 [Zizania palustris]|uniref:DUF7806 domain-containing protein n=1 Tax=Zizania palustris TaxID=103762 RepID=A0A8J5V0R3_ZIZPA|nr:hypothetical protein GUJ93_ZPchr0008g11402 [Zizania palustris]KAG8045196.1 hypothetical protein GUJ93_ZPchr0008g11402 [Zizania palustris]KAG8045197.1 hypothetical protein GUJ93_ZPchr0008g11402 [Zizania palustris]